MNNNDNDESIIIVIYNENDGWQRCFNDAIRNDEEQWIWLGYNG